MLLVERQHPVIQRIRRHQRVPPVVELHHRHLTVRVDERLLINPPHPFHIAHVERILRPQIPRMLALDPTFRTLRWQYRATRLGNTTKEGMRQPYEVENLPVEITELWLEALDLTTLFE